MMSWVAEAAARIMASWFNLMAPPILHLSIRNNSNTTNLNPKLSQTVFASGSIGLRDSDLKLPRSGA